MLKSEKTKQFIIEKTASIFTKNGFAGTSISHITEATGLTKGSIYGNFENKEAVALDVFNYNVKCLSLAINNYTSRGKNFQEKLTYLILYYRDNLLDILIQGGCPILNAAIEADDAASFMRQTVSDTFRLWIKEIKTMLDKGIANGEFKTVINSQELANTFIILIEGGIAISKITKSTSYLESALGRMEKILKEEVYK